MVKNNPPLHAILQPPPPQSAISQDYLNVAIHLNTKMLGNHVFWLLMLFYTHFAALSVTFRAVAFYSYPPPQGRGTPLYKL